MQCIHMQCIHVHTHAFACNACTCIHLHWHSFLWLGNYNINWATQVTLSNNEAYAFLACLLHYIVSPTL